MKALAYGEALVDCFPDRRVVAGAPLHVAVHLADLGWESALATRVGRDADGDRIVALLEERGVDAALVERDDALPTGTVTIRLDRAGGHAFEIHRPAAWDAIEGPAALPPCDALVYGSLAGRAERSRATLLRLLASARAALRVFDVNLRPPDVRDDVLAAGLEAAHLAKAAEDEVPVVAHRLGLGDPETWFDVAPSLRWVCVTKGARGADLLVRGGARHAVAAAPVDVVDSVGAGDAFTAGLVDALAKGRGERAALEQARDRAAKVLAKRGGLL